MPKPKTTASGASTAPESTTKPQRLKPGYTRVHGTREVYDHAGKPISRKNTRTDDDDGESPDE